MSEPTHEAEGGSTFEDKFQQFLLAAQRDELRAHALAKGLARDHLDQFTSHIISFIKQTREQRHRKESAPPSLRVSGLRMATNAAVLAATFIAGGAAALFATHRPQALSSRENINAARPGVPLPPKGTRDGGSTTREEDVGRAEYPSHYSPSQHMRWDEPEDVDPYRGLYGVYAQRQATTWIVQEDGTLKRGIGHGRAVFDVDGSDGSYQNLVRDWLQEGAIGPGDSVCITEGLNVQQQRTVAVDIQRKKETKDQIGMIRAGLEKHFAGSARVGDEGIVEEKEGLTYCRFVLETL